MLSIGALIWISVRPIIRLVLCVSAGFILTALDIFSPSAARGAGQLILNITLPSLMFSKIVPAFNSQNIAALGPLVLVGFIYEIIGGIMAWIIREMFWVPYRFRYGILVAGGWGNWGDIPTAVIMSITAAAPFTSSDQDLAVAYISAFILVFMVSLFPMGGHKLVAMDFVGPDREVSEIRPSLWNKISEITKWCMLSIRHRQQSSEKAFPDLERDLKDDKTNGKLNEKCDIPIQTDTSIHDDGLKKRVAFYPGEGSTAVPTEIMSQSGTPVRSEVGISRIGSPAPTITHVDEHLHDTGTLQAVDTTTETSSPISRRATILRRAWNIARAFMKSLLAPSTLAIILSLPISLITPLKALFVEDPGAGIPNAPDGQPPLAFILDTTTFIAGASVPLGLFCLGNALASMKLPRGQWHTLPLGAIFWFAITKMVVTPVLGVLICQGLSNAGIIDPNDKVLRFVTIFFSCVPTATTQVYLTQVYSGTGTAEHLSPFLIPQYILMFISMPILTVYTLNILF